MAKKRTVEAEKPNDDEKSPEQGRKDALLKRMLERYKLLSDAWEANHKRALAAMRFRAGEQWPEEIKKEREEQKRPCLVVDKGNQYVKQVVNDGRMNRPSVKVLPVGDKGDVKVAEAFMGLIRGILSRSNADEAFDTALDHAAGSGFGFFRVLTEYAGDRTFNQDIMIRRIRNPLAVMIDPACQMADFSDAEDGFICDDMSKAEFARIYPNAEAVNWKADAGRYENGWLEELTVRVVEYWYKEPQTETLLLLRDGTSVLERDYQEATARGETLPEIVRQRDVDVMRVKWCRASGAEILEEREWAGRFIPIVPVIGVETDIDGKVSYTGLLEPAFDAMRLYNFSRTAYAERVALSPKAPWLVEEQQIADFPEWETANTENHAYLKYKATSIDGHLVPAPSRVNAADVPSGFSQDMQISEHDIQSALGMFAASIGAPSNEKSGRAIMARQREGDVATFHFQDNLNRAVRFLGRILVDLIPKVYDTKRVVRILEEDGKSSEVMVDPTLEMANAKLPGPHGEALAVFNLSVGEYDVDIASGPSYTTKRQETAEAMFEMLRANPSLWTTHGDLIVKSQDWPGADEFAKRTKAVMPPPLKAAIDEADAEDDEGPSPEMRQVMEAAQAAVAARDEQIAKMGAALEEMKRKLDTEEGEQEVAEKEAAIKAKEAEIKAYDAVTKRLELALQSSVTPADALAIMEEAMPDGSGGDMLTEFRLGMEALVRAVLAPRERQMVKPNGEILRVIDAPVMPAQPQETMQ